MSLPLASNPLIQVTPGLMIWTIVCFLIALYVLKRYAFGPIQHTIDQRRERIRQSLDEADQAREEARKLLEEHRKLIASAQTDAEQILSEARRIGDANERRMREELEADRQRRLEETRKQIEAETRRALEQIRLEVVDLSLLAATKVTRKSLDDADQQAPDRGGRRRARLLRAGGQQEVSVVDRVYAKALFEAAQEGKKLEPVREQLAQLVEAEREVPELRELLRNPQVDPRARRAALEDVLTGSEELLRNFLLVLADKGRAGQLEEIASEFERLVAEHEGIVHAELTTAVELSDDEAQKLLQQIEQASGRKVEATRTVDPDLIGGIVLQVGSHRLDASVRGRLDRLRRQLVTA